MITSSVLLIAQSRDVDNGEPLVRFSFAKFLANPCGLQPSPSLRNQIVNKESSPDISNTPFSQETLQLIEPFRQQYIVNRSLFTAEDRRFIFEEFLLIIQEVKHRLTLLHPLTVSFLIIHVTFF